MSNNEAQAPAPVTGPKNDPNDPAALQHRVQTDMLSMTLGQLLAYMSSRSTPVLVGQFGFGGDHQALVRIMVDNVPPAQVITRRETVVEHVEMCQILQRIGDAFEGGLLGPLVEDGKKTGAGFDREQVPHLLEACSALALIRQAHGEDYFHAQGKRLEALLQHRTNGGCS